MSRTLSSHSPRTDHIAHAHARTTRPPALQHPIAPALATRRTALLSALTLRPVLLAAPAIAAPPQQLLSVQAIEVLCGMLRRNWLTPPQEEAARRYAARDFTGTLSLLDELVRRAPDSARFREMRAQTLVDAKRFSDSLVDYNAALEQSALQGLRC